MEEFPVRVVIIAIDRGTRWYKILLRIRLQVANAKMIHGIVELLKQMFANVIIQNLELLRLLDNNKFWLVPLVPFHGYVNWNVPQKVSYRLQL